MQVIQICITFVASKWETNPISSRPTLRGEYREETMTTFNQSNPFIISPENNYEYNFTALRYTSSKGDLLIHLTHPNTREEARSLMAQTNPSEVEWVDQAIERCWANPDTLWACIPGNGAKARYMRVDDEDDMRDRLRWMSEYDWFASVTLNAYFTDMLVKCVWVNCEPFDWGYDPNNDIHPDVILVMDAFQSSWLNSHGAMVAYQEVGEGAIGWTVAFTQFVGGRTYPTESELFNHNLENVARALHTACVNVGKEQEFLNFLRIHD